MIFLINGEKNLRGNVAYNLRCANIADVLLSMINSQEIYFQGNNIISRLSNNSNNIENILYKKSTFFAKNVQIDDDIFVDYLSYVQRKDAIAEKGQFISYNFIQNKADLEKIRPAHLCDQSCLIMNNRMLLVLKKQYPEILKYYRIYTENEDKSQLLYMHAPYVEGRSFGAAALLGDLVLSNKIIIGDKLNDN